MTINPFELIINKEHEAFKTYIKTSNINILNGNNENLLHVVIDQNAVDLIEVLLDKDICLEQKNNLGNTPLMNAIIKNQLRTVEILVRNNANINTVNNNKQTPIRLACLLDRNLIIDLLLSLGALTNTINLDDENIYFDLVRGLNTTTLKRFIESDNDLKRSINYFEETLLHVAVKSNSYDMTKFLLSKGLSVHVKNKLQETPLFYACKNENIDIVRLLLEYNAFVDLKNIYDETLLDQANNQKFKDTLNQTIREYDANHYKKEYPIHYYAIIGDILMLKFHINVYNVHMKDCFSKTVFDYAKEMNNKAILKLLLEFKLSLN